MKPTTRCAQAVILVAVLVPLTACGDTAGSETPASATTAKAAATTTEATTTTTEAATTTAPTTTTMPAITAAPELIRVAPGALEGNFRLEVLEGDYKVASGATLRAGSSLLNIPEELLLFPKGLRIDVAEDVTLGGEVFVAGSELIVNAAGEFVGR